MARPKSEDPKTGLNTRHRESTLARAEALGKVTGRSMRAVVADALEDYVAREEKKLAKQKAKETVAA